MAIEVCGGSRVQGTLRVQGSKNAVLPIMAASVLCQGETVITNCPDITDVHAMSEVIRRIGGQVTYEKNCLVIDSSAVGTGAIEEEKVKEIRASVLFLGSLLARFSKVKIHYPGGCSIGSRPIDFHLQGFNKMGVVTSECGEYICCEAADGLCGAEIAFPFPSVGATENIILAAVLAEGITRIKNAAREPEIMELCGFLRRMGARIHGDGTSQIEIQGVRCLSPVQWQLGTDRIALLTWCMMAAGCGGDIFLESTQGLSKSEMGILSALGCEVWHNPVGIRVSQQSVPQPVSYLCTKPYPGFPTDGQSLLMAALCKGSGVSILEEGIFENRFRMIRQLRKMGANIDAVSNRACITGVTRLHGADVEADDLRSGAGLLIAAAMAEGVSRVSGEHYIYRGYEAVEKQMQKLGIGAGRKQVLEPAG
ncbi:MAG: UDP-N-acetylglucosamine 1-carboxyvinyltransferase [Eubacterium sp.]|jgi:UDP-N-acetylglucosamine 1-carboxyvinyltransferase|nr:UDP-N-acetylglucosamine 1-carboxyvinyltransferase [Eubacterium sp.]